jgi:hypothetical protein
MRKQTYIVIGFTALVLSGCGSTKTVVDSKVKVAEQTRTHTDSTTVKETVTKHFGDSLKAQNFIPVNPNQDTTKKTDTPTVKPFTITGESAGVKFKETFTPTYTKGVINGLNAAIDIIAKPTATTDTHETTHSNVHATTKKDSTSKVESTVTKTSWLGLPSWVWWAVGIVLLLVIIYFVKPFLKFF